ncbi:MAG TPA: 2-C-methyl-D-erythritol 2,4-cyclodiphosphate synthase [Phycisphaerales bacterium]|nr:2-C-methyl-D-erythritol 2,4-cyclodiphosphate synthase [Phycisphaerales bacterium]
MTTRPAPPDPRAPRIGHGWDLHRLAPIPEPGHPPTGEAGRPLVLGGVPLGSPVGPVAHSDGDVLLHAVTDALLGAIAAPDIGQLFPDTDPGNRGRASAEFVRAAAERVRAAGYAVGNMDCTIIAQHVRVGPHRQAIRESVAALLGVEAARVNVKGKTHEGVDALGEARAIAAHCVVLLLPVPV